MSEQNTVHRTARPILDQRHLGLTTSTPKNSTKLNPLESSEMKHVALAVMLALGTLALAQQAHAAVCVNGVYRAGCVGPHGAAVVHKPYYHRGHSVSCVNGVYRAGCVGPHGAAVVRKRY